MRTLLRLSSLFLLPGLILLSGCHAGPSEVVVYASQDQVYAEPILDGFQQQRKISVKPVFDSEAVKTVGLANRLLAEKGRPRADLFWNNEEFRTRQLLENGVLSTNDWAAFGYRKRQWVVNTNLCPLSKAPHSLAELASAEWRGKFCMAYPLFGSTSTHMLVLRQHWGEAAWREWCHALVSNQTLLVEGNSSVVRMVASGRAWIGLTDSDDIRAAQREGSPVAALDLPRKDSFLIRNTVAVVQGAPHRENGRRLIEYLQSPEVLQQLMKAGAVEGQGTEPDVNWRQLIDTHESAISELKGIFLRDGRGASRVEPRGGRGA